jgi:hypothetical protein
MVVQRDDYSDIKQVDRWADTWAAAMAEAKVARKVVVMVILKANMTAEKRVAGLAGYWVVDWDVL